MATNPYMAQLSAMDGNRFANNGEKDQAAYGNTPTGQTPSFGGSVTSMQSMLQPAQHPQQNLGMGPAAPSEQSNPYIPSGIAAAATPQQSDSSGLGKNPWLQQQGAALTAQSNQNLKQNILPGIGQGAQAQGMYGSSRQGTAEGIAMGNAQTGLDSALANMYSQSYGQDQQAQLQREQMANQTSIANSQMANQLALAKMNDSTSRYGMDNQYRLGNKTADQSYNLGLGNLGLGNKQADNSYDLGLRNNDLGFGQLDFNINQGNFDNQLKGANFGLNVYGQMNGYNQQGTNNGTQMQNTPLNYFNGFNNNVTALAGQGGNNVVAPQGSEWGAGLGAGLGTYGMLTPKKP